MFFSFAFQKRAFWFLIKTNIFSYYSILELGVSLSTTLNLNYLGDVGIKNDTKTIAFSLHFAHFDVSRERRGPADTYLNPFISIYSDSSLFLLLIPFNKYK